ncbi:hypothetical protein EV714DRAFT_275026 [Schizophyllum commune]
MDLSASGVRKHDWYCPQHRKPLDSDVLSEDGAQSVDAHMSAIHNMEAIFWETLYFCITSSGPRGQKRPKYTVTDVAAIKGDEERQAIRHLLWMTYYFFRADESTRLENRRQLFSHGLEDFDKYILVCFHGYFEPLKQTMRLAFFELLRIAYEFRGFEFYYIHDRVIEFLRNLITELSSLKRIEPEMELEL